MRFVRTLIAAWLGIAATLLWSGTPASASSSSASSNAHQLIQGSGSSWAANAITQWIADVHANGLQVVFSSNGSAQGRIDYANKTADFAVSDIPYQGKDPVSGANDTSNGRQYAYLPIVSGGTALPYHILKNGQLVRNLRLSGATIAKIFTQQITNWDDAAITKDNNGNAMPNLAIIPVQHSEGSGSSYQFTRYLATQFPSIWKAGAREYFPPANGSAVAQNGSDGVMNFLTSGAANGAIGYDEYSYALGKNYPVAKVLNTDGYYTLPNQYNVAVALTKAQINTDKSSQNYLIQNLDQVYTDSDSRVYPISSYSYAVIPTASNDSTMNTAKRQTLADYLQYSVCQGQAEMGRIGYSPLPLNLVQSSFDQITKLHAADAKVDVSSEKPSSCHNPTFVAGHPDENYLAKIAPKPEACDKSGAGPCTGNGNTGQLNPGAGGKVIQTGNQPSGGTTGGTGTGGSGGGGTSGSSGGGTSGSATTGSGTGTPIAGGGGALSGTTGSAGVHRDPNTGQLVANSGSGATSGSGTTGGSEGQAVANSTVLRQSQSGSTDLTLGILAGGILLGTLIAPALIAGRLSRKDGS